MPENKNIKELMVPLNEYPYVYDTNTLKDAIGVLRKHRLGKDHLHRSILVFSKTEKVDNEEKLIGIVNIIPVFENKKAVGIIRAIDILDYIAEML